MSDDWSFLDGLNLTELTEMASSQNVNAHRGLPREVLVSVVKGEAVNLPPRQIDVWRQSIFTFVDTHWQQLSPLLSCPMKMRQPHACVHCPDMQVAECVVLNHGTIVAALNLAKRKKKETK